MTTLTVNSETSDGRLTSSNTNYVTCLAGSSIVVSNTATDNALCQQNRGGSARLVRLGFYKFDTSSIPESATIVSATLSIYGTTDSSTQDFTAEVYTSSWSDPLSSGDWVDPSTLSSANILATFDTSGTWSTVAYNDFTSAAGMLSAITKEGTTSFMIASDRMRQAIEPADGVSEGILGYWAEGANPPKLVVVYSDGGLFFGSNF